jgi:hypothetical protein
MGSFGVGTGLNSAGAVQGYDTYGVAVLNQNSILTPATYYPVAGVAAAGYATGATIIGGVGTLNTGEPWVGTDLTDSELLGNG